MLRVAHTSRHDLQQMHSLIPSADFNGDKWTSRQATEGVAHLYSSTFPNICLCSICVFMSTTSRYLLLSATLTQHVNMGFRVFACLRPKLKEKCSFSGVGGDQTRVEGYVACWCFKCIRWCRLMWMKCFRIMLMDLHYQTLNIWFKSMSEFSSDDSQSVFEFIPDVQWGWRRGSDVGSSLKKQQFWYYVKNGKMKADWHCFYQLSHLHSRLN